MAVQLDAAFNYNDLQGLDSLKQGLRNNSDEATRAVAQQFESMFLSLIVKSMRDATDVLASDLGHSYQTRFYQDMYDQQLALSMSQMGGFGLADILYEQIKQTQNPVPADLNNLMVKPLTESDRPVIPASLFRALSGDTVPTDSESVSPTEAGSADLLDLPSLMQTPFDQQLPLPALSPDTLQPSIPAADASKGQLFQSPEDFIARLSGAAETAAQKIGIEPKYLLAQAALETGWGQHVIQNNTGGSSHNFFGIKADTRWTGEAALTTTHEFIEGRKLTITAPFRSYDSVEQAFDDYARFVTESPRYQQAVAHANDGAAYFQHLQAAGYATDPNYADKVMRIASSSWFDQA